MRRKRIIPQIIQMMASTRTVRASKWILNNCSRRWEHSIETRKADLLYIEEFSVELSVVIE